MTHNLRSLLDYYRKWSWVISQGFRKFSDLQSCSRKMRKADWCLFDRLPRASHRATRPSSYMCSSLGDVARWECSSLGRVARSAFPSKLNFILKLPNEIGFRFCFICFSSVTENQCWKGYFKQCSTTHLCKKSCLFSCSLQTNAKWLTTVVIFLSASSLPWMPISDL